MQPYFMPYIGYFQLIEAVDVFVLYDNIKYTKKGWINRNRMLLNDTDSMFSLPLKSASNVLHVVQRELAEDFNRKKLLSQFRGAYSRAPYFDKTFKLLEVIVGFEDNNLFEYIHHSLIKMCCHLGIETEIRASSTIPNILDLKGQEKVLSICGAMKADRYINAIGGIDLYNKEDFRARGIELQFIKSKPYEYAQFAAPFVPWLSIVDVLMFNPLSVVQDCIHSNFELI